MHSSDLLLHNSCLVESIYCIIYCIITGYLYTSILQCHVIPDEGSVTRVEIYRDLSFYYCVVVFLKYHDAINICCSFHLFKFINQTSMLYSSLSWYIQVFHNIHNFIIKYVPLTFSYSFPTWFLMWWHQNHFFFILSYFFSHHIPSYTHSHTIICCNHTI